MSRFYLPAAAVIMLARTPAAAQTATIPEQPWLGTALTADMLRELPVSNNPLTLFDTVQTEAIGNRFLAAGLNVATAPQTGGLLNSWTQTQFRFGDITITDPRSGGTPLVLPILPLFDRVSVATGAMTVDENAPALSMTLVPLRPGTAWVRAFEGSFAGAALTSDAAAGVPHVDRVGRWTDGNAAIGGPVNQRLGLAVAASWRGLSHFEAPATTSADDRLASVFTHAVFAATPRDEIRAIGVFQRATTAAVENSSVHVQSTWERRETGRLTWRIFGGYTERKRTAPVATPLVVDSLTSDPVSDVIAGSAGSARRWAIGARVSPAAKRLPAFGIDVENARARVVPSGVLQVRELVDGVPARIWDVRVPPSTDFRHMTSLAIHANEHVTSGPLTLDAGLRLESLTGRADAAGSGVQWTTLLPRATLEWQVTRTAGIAAIAGVRRSAYQLPLDVLAIGDPAAPVADVSRWNGVTVGPAIARVGPGAGSDVSFAQIDPDLKRPTTDELLLGVRSRPFKGFEVELTRVVKRERSLMAVVDTGVPASSYSAFLVPDPSYVAATAGAFDKPFVLAYSRPAGTYGRDRYRLANPDLEEARSWALQLDIRATTERVTVLAGIALTWAYASAAAIGYLPTENDQNVLGSLFVDANAATDARGQLFHDRSHAGKIAGIYRFPRRVSLGIIARYQDGQPFARLVSTTFLNQGPTMVRAYRNGGAAFTYTGTLDVRVQKAFRRGRSTITAGIDVYNVPGMTKEVDEYVVAGPAFRTPTAIQPPRTAVVSVRLAY